MLRCMSWFRHIIRKRGWRVLGHSQSKNEVTYHAPGFGTHVDQSIDPNELYDGTVS